jgi:hypothetical protein
MKCRHFMTQLTLRFMKFICSIVKSDNTKLHWMLKHLAANGNTMSNIKYVSQRWGLSAAAILNGSNWCLPLNDDDDTSWMQRAHAILDFLSMNYEMDTKDIVVYLCTY